ncbi:MAG TPA: subclass B3 metallo-beta-lactamase [Bryobacteraceae bacterium]|nr:subclass B3 metallo-beta-lactamase [Bryobacteraceae bacterium]
MRPILALAALAANLSFAQSNPSWSRPYPAHKIFGNLYYVGTEELACFLLTSPEGHILINTGLEDSAPLLRDSIRSVGARLEDVKILLTMQAHFDHVGALAEVQRISGAKVMIAEADARIVEDGGKSDPHFGKGSWFKPVKVDRRLKHGDKITLGNVELTVVQTPGHSRGSVSYTLNLNEGGVARKAAIVNMMTLVMPLKLPSYPTIAADFETSFARQKQLQPEIWVAAHASQYDMQRKHEAGSFVDSAGYKQKVAEMEEAFRTERRKQGI